jgi:hypothetical protein
VGFVRNARENETNMMGGRSNKAKAGTKRGDLSQSRKQKAL